MTDREKEALDYITGQMKCGYIDISNTYPDEFEFNIIKEAIDLYKKKEEIEKKDKIIDEIQKEVRDHIGFENRLKRDNKEPDLFNQGRFYVANNINNILKGR